MEFSYVRTLVFLLVLEIFHILRVHCSKTLDSRYTIPNFFFFCAHLPPTASDLNNSGIMENIYMRNRSEIETGWALLNNINQTQAV